MASRPVRHFFVFGTLILMLLFGSVVTAIAQSPSISIETDKSSVAPGDSLVVRGSVSGVSQSTLVGIEIEDVESNTLLIRTVQTDQNGNFSLEFKVPQSAKPGQLGIFAGVSIDGQSIKGSHQAEISEQNITNNTNQDNTANSNNSTCIIATAAFGSELAPQVQFLRNFRDHHILATSTGSSFMNVFNAWYYSFSPYVAEYERGQPWMQETVKFLIYPLLGILSAAEKAYSTVPGNYGSLLAGLIASSAIGALYFGPGVVLIPKVRHARLNYRILLAAVGVVSVAVVASSILANPIILMVTTSSFVIVIIAVSSAVFANSVSRLVRKTLAYSKV